MKAKLLNFFLESPFIGLSPTLLDQLHKHLAVTGIQSTSLPPPHLLRAAEQKQKQDRGGKKWKRDVISNPLELIASFRWGVQIPSESGIAATL